MAKMENACMVRLDADDRGKLQAAADDHGVTIHAMARLIIQNYLAGWNGPYVLRKPLGLPETEA